VSDIIVSAIASANKKSHGICYAITIREGDNDARNGILLAEKGSNEVEANECFCAFSGKEVMKEFARPPLF
jgi:hypothetical protein